MTAEYKKSAGISVSDMSEKLGYAACGVGVAGGRPVGMLEGGLAALAAWCGQQPVADRQRHHTSAVAKRGLTDTAEDFR